MGLKPGPKRIKNNIKTHIETLKIQKLIRGGPPTSLTPGGFVPPLMLFPLFCHQHSMASGFVQKWENRIPGLFSFFKVSNFSQFCINKGKMLFFSAGNIKVEIEKKALLFSLIPIPVIITGTTTQIEKNRSRTSLSTYI